ncbi:MAG: serine/threonine protein kinase [Planctomycetota bacterium]|nr:serine/threonine protein kinase [Planctomycetota bacterium]
MAAPDSLARLKRYRLAHRVALAGGALLAATVLLGVFVILTAESFEDLARRYFQELSKRTAEEIHGQLEAAEPILQECLSLAEQGDLPVKDAEKLGVRLAARLRSQRNLAWLSYSDQESGRFVGARRSQDGSIVINRSHPKENGGKPREWLVALDGSRQELNTEKLSSYDPREQAWYTEAAKTSRIYWSHPFTFHEGVRGITAAAAHRNPKDRSLRGVFTADFFLTSLSDYLSEIATRRSAYVYLLEADGSEIVTHKAPPEGASAGRSAELRRAAQEAFKREPLEDAARNFRRVSVGSELYYASMQTVPVAEGVEWQCLMMVPWQQISGHSPNKIRWTVVLWWASLAVASLLLAGGISVVKREGRHLPKAETTHRMDGGFALGGGDANLQGLELPANMEDAEVPPDLLEQAADLVADKMLATAPRVRAGGRVLPALSGIPMLRRLSQGAMGSVYLGYHPRLKLPVAVKVLSYILAEQEPEWVKRFYREAQVASRVKSPHLVGVMDVNEEQGLYYLVMEYVNGQNAGDYARRRLATGQPPLDVREALDLIVAATEGMAAAHAAGIVHRDIKPDNILLPFMPDRDVVVPGQAKLADLGLARMEEHRVSLTDARFTMGTVGYMAPEQALNFKEAGKPADVFAMGATLYDLLANTPPFAGTSPFGVMTQTVESPHDPIHAKRTDIGRDLSKVIDKCLEKNPEDRYQDGQELLAELKLCRARLG